MPHCTTTPAVTSAAQHEHRRAARPLCLLSAMPDERTVEAMDDEFAAEEVMCDLATEPATPCVSQLAADTE